MARPGLRKKCPEEQDDVVETLAQRRQPHGDGGQPEVQIPAEAPGLGLRPQVPVRGRRASGRRSSATAVPPTGL